MKWWIVAIFVVLVSCKQKYYPLKVEYFKETLIIHKDTRSNTILDTVKIGEVRILDYQCPVGY